MSAQTGRASLAPPPPASTRFVRAAHAAQQLRSEPNPVWLREMRQAARLTRTPLILAGLTATISLLICSIGGLASIGTEPAKVGAALFHTYFSLAFAVVMWVGPAVSASTIASEKSGRTWQALMLTGLGPGIIARGKFLASLSYISMYVVMLMPVGVLPFLFGGVTATEVIAAFVLLFAFSVLAVTFGLSLSSRFNSAAAAILVTLIISFPLSIFIYVMAGPVLASAVNSTWPSVPEWAPVWLPIAYARVELSLEYLVFLVLGPIALLGLPSWFLYESTLANMMGPSDDRSTGIRRWFLVTAPVLSIACIPVILAVDGSSYVEAAGVCSVLLLLFYFFMALVFAGEPFGPSRRVLANWSQTGTGRIKRFLGPSLLNASLLLAVMAVGSQIFLTVITVLALLISGRHDPEPQITSTLAFTVYSACFSLFFIGFVTFSRARSESSIAPRIISFLVVLLACIAPWIVMAIGGVLTKHDDALLLSAPSPTFMVVLADKIISSSVVRSPNTALYFAAGTLSATVWGLLGLVLYSMGSSRVRRVVREHHTAQAELQTLLDAEDQNIPTEINQEPSAQNASNTGALGAEEPSAGPQHALTYPNPPGSNSNS